MHEGAVQPVDCAIRCPLAIRSIGFSLSKRLSADGGTWQAVSDSFFGVNQPFEHDGVVW